MILHNILESEDHDAYRRLEFANLARQYDFLRSIITAAAVDTESIAMIT